VSDSGRMRSPRPAARIMAPIIVASAESGNLLSAG
jgi:hypothetical protein